MRDLALRYPKATLVIFVLVLVVFGYGNIIAKRGGVLDKAILNKEDHYYLMDQAVQKKRMFGFEGTEFVPLILKFPGGIESKKDLKKIYQLTEQAKEVFGNRILSLSEVPDYHDTGIELLDLPYIHPAIFKDPNFDLEEWKREVKNDSGVYGILVGRDFDWAAVVIYMRPGYDEMETAWQIVELLERRKIGWLERFYKSEIHPLDPNLGVSGWLMGRWILHQGLNRDMFSLIVLGLLMTFVVFAFSVGSFWQALLASFIVVVPAILMVRGSVGLIELLGWDIRERVYLLLAYANCIVQGISFSLHKFETFNHYKDWQKAKEVDWLIFVTTLIAVGGFGTLYWFQVLTIRELGILSALGVVYLGFLSIVVLPAIYSLLVRKEQLKQREFKTFSLSIEKLVNGCTWLTTRFSFQKTLMTMIVVLLVVVILAVILVSQGRLIIKTKPLEFIRETLVYQTGQFLNETGRIGFDFLDLLVEPAETRGDIYEADFIRAVWQYQQDLKKKVGAREVSSILGTLAKIAQESYKKPFIEISSEEVAEAFFLIEGNLASAVQRQLWYEKGIRVSISAEMKDSNEIGDFVKSALELAKKYPQLRVSAFGKLAQYPQIDWYIRMGKPKNLFGSQWVIILVCALMIAWKGKKLEQKGFSSQWRLSSFWGGVIMSVPFIFSSGMMCLTMIVLAIPLDIATAAITALAINASIDFSIYFVDAYQEALTDLEPIKAVKKAMAAKGKIIIEDMILNAICFDPLLTSSFQPIRELGWIMGVMLIYCCIGSLIIMPPFLVWATESTQQLEPIPVYRYRCV
jgi:predicted RND superfamily exporter protein